MAKKLLMNNNSGEIILCKNYFPGEQPFYLLQDKMIDWDNYELYMNIDLSNYTKNDWGGVMSLGADIISWEGNRSIGNLHVYYNGATKRIRFQSIITPWSSGQTSDFTLLDLDMIEVIINRNGMFLNGTFKHNNEHFQRIYNNFKTTPISIGSQSGDYKGVAKYNLVCLRKYRERRI